MSWYVVFSEGSETLIQTAEDQGDALSVAFGLSRRGQRILCVGPLGAEAHSQYEIKGPVLRDTLRKMAQENRPSSKQRTPGAAGVAVGGGGGAA